MGMDSPAVILYDASGNALAVQSGSATPASTPAIMVAGSDGTNSRYLKVDSSGNQLVAGLGTAGAPSGGVISIQGVGSGTAVPISGTVTASNASVGALGSAIPASGTQMGASDGTNLQVPRVFDVDSGGGTSYVLGVNLRISGSGGSVEGGTASNPIRVDPTGTTTQPVKEVKAATSALTNVAGSATNVTVLASNANRLRCIITNDNTSILYLKFGATASATSYTYRLLPQASITEDKYTGIIDGIWGVAGSGAARVTELTA